MLRSTFSTTTMASSTTMPMAKHQTEERQQVDGEPQREHEREGAEQGDDDRRGADDGGAEVLQEEIDDEHHERDGHEEGLDEPRRWTGARTPWCRAGHQVVQPVGEARLHRPEGLAHRLRHLERIRAGLLVDPR